MKINPRRVPVIALLWVAFSVITQCASGAAARHTLWKVEGPQCTVHLLGSIHVLRKSDYPLAQPIEAAYSNASIVAFETDMEELEQPAVALKLMSKGALPPGETLSKHLTPDVYRLWTNHLQQTGLPAEVFEPLTPAMAGVTLTVLEMQKLGLDPNQGVDKHFFALARKAGKKVVSLESVDFQITLLTEFTREEGNRLLETTLNEMDQLKKELDDMVQAWKTGKAEDLEKLLSDAMKEAPTIYKRMVTDRNRNWVPKIAELTQGTQDAVVIVGAAHLVGKEGVVELLKKRGFKVVQE